MGTQHYTLVKKELGITQKVGIFRITGAGVTRRELVKALDGDSHNFGSRCEIKKHKGATYAKVTVYID